MRRRSWLLLAACLLAPAFAGLLRKVTPGQPAALEPAGIGMVLVASAWLLTQGRVLPRWIRGPLLVWAYFQAVYAVLAVAEGWAIGMAATLIRIAPMLMAPIAYAAVRNHSEFRRSSQTVALLAPLLLPAGLAVALFGITAVPAVLQPIQSLVEMGRAGRSGVPGVAGVFSTFHVMGLSMMAIFFLALSNVALSEAEHRPTTRWWLLALTALVLVYLSTRRGAFLGAFIGLGVYVLQRRTVPLRLIVPAVVVVALAVGLEIYGAIGQERFARGRGELLLEAFNIGEILFRLAAVFLPHLWMWIQLTPFGTFLGAAGPEGAALGWDILSRFSTDLVEVGGAQLLLEMGVLGALVMPPVVLALMWRIHKRSKGLRCHRAITLLAAYQGVFFLIYYLKEATAVTGVSMAQLLFWAVPGLGAALIERERRERRYMRALYRMHVARLTEAHVGAE